MALADQLYAGDPGYQGNGPYVDPRTGQIQQWYSKPLGSYGANSWQEWQGQQQQQQAALNQLTQMQQQIAQAGTDTGQGQDLQRAYDAALAQYKDTYATMGIAGNRGLTSAADNSDQANQFGRLGLQSGQGGGTVNPDVGTWATQHGFNIMPTNEDDKKAMAALGGPEKMWGAGQIVQDPNFGPVWVSTNPQDAQMSYDMTQQQNEYWKAHGLPGGFMADVGGFFNDSALSTPAARLAMMLAGGFGSGFLGEGGPLTAGGPSMSDWFSNFMSGGGGATPGADAGIGDAGGGDWWNQGVNSGSAGGSGGFNYSAADQLGLQQMGQAAGLSGQALTDFVNSGMAGTLTGAAVGTGAGGLGPSGVSGPGDIPPPTSAFTQGGTGTTGAGSALSRLLSGNATAADYASLLSSGGSALLGIAGADASRSANNSAADKMLAIGEPFRNTLSQSYSDPNFLQNHDAGYTGAIDQVMQSYLRKASTGGNPFENSGVSMEANKYVTQNTALPQLNADRTNLVSAGSMGIPNANQPNINAAQSAIYPYTAATTGLGGLSSTTQPFDINAFLRQLQGGGTNLNAGTSL